MSAPPNRRDRPAPLHERSQSQNNKLAIRIVPYSPPRLSAADGEARTPSQASSRAQTTADKSPRKREIDHVLDDEAGTSLTEGSQVRSGTFARTRVGREHNEGYVSSPGSALSSPSVPSLSLAGAKDDSVSGAKPIPGTSGEDRGPGAQTAPVLRLPSARSDIIPNNAATRQPASAVTEPAHHDERPPFAHPFAPASEPRLASPSAPASSATSPTEADLPRPLSRRRNFVAVHADKTFSLTRTGPRSDGSAAANTKSPPLSYSSRASSSQERPSIDAWGEDRPSSPLTTGTDTTVPFTSSPGISSSHLAEEAKSSSPWNYRMVGGLRKVPNASDLKQDPPHQTTATAAEPSLAPLLEFSVYRDNTGGDDDENDDDDSSSRQLVPKPSFASAQTASTTSETTNYKVYGQSPSPVELSTDSLPIPIASTENYEILAQSSPVGPFLSSPPGTADSEQNFVLHGDPSPPTSSHEIVLASRAPRPTYSQESLRVQPLRPVKKQSTEKFGYYKQRSRENLRARAGSLKSIKSFSSIISQEGGQAFFAAPVLINFGIPSSRSTREAGPGSSQQGQQQQLPQRPPQQLLDQGSSSWSAAEQSSSSSPLARNPVPERSSYQMIQAQPHKWSSQLSTVISESEGGSEDGPSRSVSPLSAPESHQRRNSAGWAGSTHSRQLQSISSSLAAQLEDSSHSRSDSTDRPMPIYGRGGPSGVRTVRDQDEHGDGLADLHNPSRSGLSGFFSSSNSSSRNLHSSGSSRANSLNSASLPAWARVYYGSGERRFLGAPSTSTISDESRPTSSDVPGSSSPNADHFPLSIYSPRRRAREVHPPAAQRPFSNSASMEIAPAPLPQDLGVIRPLHRKTSSIWSPHLQMDRRATRYSIWEPPSVSWSADSGILGKRNAQVVLFIVGFIFPFAWMIAALLPLPPNPRLQMLERGNNSSRSQFDHLSPEHIYQIEIIDETRYESARWWRNLNRVMSIVGLMIIGVTVALVVVGVRQGWVTRTSTPSFALSSRI